MKKLLSIAIMAMSVSMAFAQSSSGSGVLKSTPTHVATDTVINTEVQNQQLAISVANHIVTVQTVLTKVSGTPAGVVRLYGSVDGVNYVRVNPTDSLTMTDVAVKSRVFIVSPAAYSFYRVGYAGAGTMSVKMNSFAVWRKE